MISPKQIFGDQRYLSHYTAGRDNNFNLLRFTAATLVLVSHSYALSTGRAETEPLRDTFGMSLGSLAVDIFFVASGFLVTGSLLFRQNIRDFITARVLRIYPALWVALAITVTAVGLFFTTLSFRAYIAELQTWYYVTCNAVLLTHAVYGLPGAFLDTPWRGSVNGSLWSLPIELKMYVSLVGLWLVAKVWKKEPVRMLSAACIVLAILAVGLGIALFSQHRTNNFIALSGMFFSGATLRILQNRILVSHRIALAFAAALVLSALWSPLLLGIIYRLTAPYLIIYLALVPGGVVRRFNAIGDYSYGMYIYAFPIQQSIVSLCPGIGPPALIASSFFATLVMACASWHIVESRALTLKGQSMQAGSSTRELRTSV